MRLEYKEPNLEEVLTFPSDRFIFWAYKLVLRRAPDPEGLGYYLRKLGNGASKSEVLAQLYYSPEGRRVASKTPGIKRIVRKHYWRKFPVLGLLVKHETGKMEVQDEMFRAEKPALPSDYFEFAGSFNDAKGAIDIRLRPVNQLEHDQHKHLCWRSTGNDPGFAVSFGADRAIDPGWYVIELEIVSGNRSGLSKCYLDTGEGFNESEIVSLPFSSAKAVSRVFFSGHAILRMRFDPMETGGEFCINAMQLTSVKADMAIRLMCDRIVGEHPDYSGMRTDELLMIANAVSSIKSVPVLEFVEDAYLKTFNATSVGQEYAKWIDDVEAASLPNKSGIIELLSQLPEKPLVSIIVPVFNTPECFLRDCIESVRAQSYVHWELCIADDLSTEPHVRKILSEYVSLDSRIRVVHRKINGHISKASNSALKIAQGRYIALLDHDDMLAEHALYFIVKALNENREAQIIYSDEDKIDEKGNRFDPHFKCDWNPDLFLSQNYVSHLGVYSRALLNSIGGFRAGVEGSQDFDLLLRCLPHVSAKQIIHVPRVLYHWRAIAGSTAKSSVAKDYTTQAGVRALSDYLTQLGGGGHVEAGMVANTYRVRYAIPSPAPLVSLLIPTRDKRELVEVCVRSILEKSTYRNFEVIILDNGSVERETLAFFESIQREDERVRVLRYDRAFNYSAINNFGVVHARGSIIGLVNNDIEVISPEWLYEMVSQVCRPEIGCVGAKLYYANDTIQHAGVICGLGGVAGHSHKYFARNHPGYFYRLVLTQSLSAVTAACLLVRREVYEEVGGLDEVNLKVAFNDVDFCLKVREAGYRNLWTPYAELYHYESISRGAEDTPEKQARFRREVEYMRSKWGVKLQRDPCYSPNLTLDREDFTLSDKMNF